MNFVDPSDIRPILVLSALSSKPVSIKSSTQFSIQEQQFLNIVSALTSNSTSKLQNNAHYIDFIPGMPQGGTYKFNVDNIAFIAEYLLLLCPFCKFSSEIELTGEIISNQVSSIFYIKEVLAHHLKYFNNGEDFVDIKIGQNSTKLIFKTVQKFNTVAFTQISPVKSIQGTAVYQNVPKQLSNRVITSSKQILLPFTSDVSVAQFLSKSQSQSLGLFLFAEMENGGRVGGEFFFESNLEPEDIGKIAAQLLLREIEGNGAIDANAQAVILMALAMSEGLVSVVRFQDLCDLSIELMRTVFEILGVIFQVENYEILGENGIVVKGVEIVVRGSGMVNVTKRGF
ncbi:RNA 3'-terminal phosphate cyclase-like protein [Spironucleus salmonicida]|uniref:RNA 3'-terminal phosphate cyclase-like protein n=1 Tax=Spironucleus salmonicida TaxID=348837 RepID=V6LJB2_9EUKA|nr:RNA 3'-terminal phosphate cyclase-like protein [Spironucleus salmonicida]|eukprot:EST44652.1 RNA 3'-terminal phosphate cyclase-like protein [Spironucleus salmonicida]